LPVRVALYVLIFAFGGASYFVGSRDILVGKYSPSIFSRVVWLLLAGISFAGVVAGGSAVASILLAGIFLAGNAAICLLSFWKGTKSFGRLEYLCLAILVASGVVWAVFDAPFLSLAISLLAHFVGGAPTYRTVWRHPKSESAGFWSLFFMASVLSLVADIGQPWQSLIFPAYFALFDGTMTFLSLRRSR
jgi:hypothetical protein